MRAASHKTISCDTSAGALPRGRGRGRFPRAVSLVEILLALGLGAMLLTAVVSGLVSMLGSVRTNQGQLQSLRAARVATDYITTQIREADEVTVTSATASSDATYPLQATEISISFDGANRAGHAASDYLEVHLKTTDLGNGKTGLRIWKNTQGVTWGGRVMPEARRRGSLIFPTSYRPRFSSTRTPVTM